MMVMKKERLDLLMTQKGLVESRAKAQGLIMAGQVSVNGSVVDKAGSSISEDAIIEIAQRERFVSRGGEKLAGALDSFGYATAGRICADVGSSTGGFTDCLLQNGASRVFCIDVGKGILHWKLRTDPRVVVMEETNARNVESLPEPIDLIVCDASFISLRTLLPVFVNWLGLYGEIITLIKPQFEAGRVEVARGKGVVRDVAIHKRVVIETFELAAKHGLVIKGAARSILVGPKGNAEFLLWAAIDPNAVPADREVLLDQLFPDLIQKEEK